MTDNFENIKLLPPPQDYDGTVKRLELWSRVSFDQTVKKIFDHWSRIPGLVNKNDLLTEFGGASGFVNLLPVQVFEEIKIDESPAIRMLRDMTRMAVSEKNTDGEKKVMVQGLVAFTVATCGSGKEWNNANDWLRENGNDLVSLTNKLCNKREKKKL